MKELNVRLMERMLGAELTAHLGHEVGSAPPPEQPNHRNGAATKRVKGSDGETPLTMPQDITDPPPIRNGEEKYESGVDTTTVLNLLDWDGASPLSLSAAVDDGRQRDVG